MILVTGASGLLGANFLFEAKKRQQAVTGVFHLHAIGPAGIPCRKVDLTKSKEVAELIREVKPRAVVHCAALSNVDACEANPDEARRQNVDASVILAQESKREGASFIYISTDAVFSGNQGMYRETDQPTPINVYAKSKWEAEKAIAAETSEALIIRTALYGWNFQDKLSLSEWILQGLSAEKPIVGFTDIIFSPILANDLSEVILDLLKQKEKGVYHVGGSESCSKYDFACALAKVFGHDPKQIQKGQSDHAGFLAKRPKNLSLDVSRIEAKLGRKMPGLEAGLTNLKRLQDSGYVKKLKGSR